MPTPSNYTARPDFELPRLRISEEEGLLFLLAAHQSGQSLREWVYDALQKSAGILFGCTDTPHIWNDAEHRHSHVVANAPQVARLVSKRRDSEEVPGLVEGYYEEE